MVVICSSSGDVIRELGLLRGCDSWGSSGSARCFRVRGTCDTPAAVTELVVAAAWVSQSQMIKACGDELWYSKENKEDLS